MNLYSVLGGLRVPIVTFFTPGYWGNSGGADHEYRGYEKYSRTLRTGSI